MTDLADKIWEAHAAAFPDDDNERRLDRLTTIMEQLRARGVAIVPARQVDHAHAVYIFAGIGIGILISLAIALIYPGELI